MASTESVTFTQFLLATLAITPKLYLHVWVGSRFYVLADPDSRGRMDTHTKVVNGVFVAFGTALGIATSWYLYRLTMKYVAEAELSLGDDLEAGLLDQQVDELLDEEEAEGSEGESPRVHESLSPRPDVQYTSTHSSREALPLQPVPRPAAAERTPSAASQPASSHARHQSEDWGEAEFSDFEERVRPAAPGGDGATKHDEESSDGEGWGLEEVAEDSEEERSPPTKGKDRWLD